MSANSHTDQVRSIADAVSGVTAAYAARTSIVKNADERAATRLAAAEANRLTWRKWADEQVAAMATLVTDGITRLPAEIDRAIALPPAVALMPDARLGLQSVVDKARAGMDGIQEGGRALLLWRAKRGSIMTGLGVAALVLLVLAGLFISGRFIRDKAEEVLATLDPDPAAETDVTPVPETIVTSETAGEEEPDAPEPTNGEEPQGGTPEDPTIEPDAGPLGKIVFQSNRDNDYEIYIMNADGSDTRQLTNNSHADRYPRVSPDGRRIVFQSRRNNNTDIYVINIDGSDERRLTFESTLDELPSWSPDGRTIIFNSWLGNNSELFTVAADGSGLRRLTDSPLDEGHAAWGAGGRIAFNGTAPGDSFFQLYTANPDMTDQRKITDSRIDEYSPEWSPDGQQILFISERGSSTNSGLYIMNPDGSAGRLLYNGSSEEWGATFSPDGAYVVFTIDQSDGTADIFMIDVAGGEPWRVSERGGYPSWVPSGESSTAPALPAQSSTTELAVSAAVARTFTDITVDAGQRVVIEYIDGQWQPGPSPAWIPVGPLGDGRVPSNDNFLVTNRPLMTLVAGVDDGLPFAVGSRLEFVAAESGALWLGPNDDDTSDNAGGLRVRVTLLDSGPGGTESGSGTLSSVPVPLPGDSLMRLTFGGTQHYTAIFAPDQSHILLSVEMDDGWQLFEADPNGGGLTRQITSGPYNHYQADYSRDGRTFLTSVNLDGDGDIYLFDSLTGEPLEQLINNPGLDYHPRFLPDGSGFIFSSDTDGDHEVYLMTFDGRQTKLTDNSTFDGFAEVSPDGQWVAFYSGRDDDYEIYVMDIKGRNPRRLTFSGGRDAGPSFSPDGRWIVFESTRTGNYEIYAVPIEGGDARRLTNTNANNWVPVVSPDGRWLMFQSDRDDEMDIYRQPWPENMP